MTHTGTGVYTFYVTPYQLGTYTVSVTFEGGGVEPPDLDLRVYDVVQVWTGPGVPGLSEARGDGVAAGHNAPTGRGLSWAGDTLGGRIWFFKKVTKFSPTNYLFHLFALQVCC